MRQPGYFWHNIGKASDEWWEYLVQTGQITTGFECQPGDQGEKILRGFIKSDTVVAYSRRFGAIGWGIISAPDSYRLLQPGCKDDRLNGEHLHRLNIDWKYTVDKLENAIAPALLLEKYGIFHPRSTSVSIDPQKAKRMIADMQNISRE